ncbi:MAG: hypothetical protein VZR73_06780 [Acutalibacteraceae bacterium]|nr:hypothetical protein [Acutalibacteraceae bacterium]
MQIRPLDSSGDVLPVLSSSAMAKESSATAVLIKERLDMMAGEWWENEGAGNKILNMLRNSRLTVSDIQSLTNYLTTYILETNGVQDVTDVSGSISGRAFSYTCRVLCDGNSQPISWTLNI